MENSKSIAALAGPTLIVMVLSEMKFWNPTLYETQIVPLIYVSGMLFFVAGLAIVRQHNIWIWSWQLVITLLGWGSILLGLTRMFYPQMQKEKFKNDTSDLIIELALILIGIFLTFKAYWPMKKS